MQTTVPVGECLKSRFFVPAWWVCAFESAFRGEKNQRAWKDVLEGGMAPAFSAAEAGLLPTFFGYLQRDFLQNSRVSPVRISPDQFEKEAGLFPDSRRKTLQKVFFSLGGLRILKNLAGMYHTLPLFEYEKWSESKDEVWLELGSKPEAGELLTGLINGYEERNRVLRGQEPLCKVLGQRPPLMLWRPLWYELKGCEQMVLLNLEKAIQWNQMCFNLDGVFGESLSNLFAFEKGLKPSQRWSLDKKVSFLARLTRKLSDHGCLRSLSSGEFMAFRDQEPFLQLLWKVTPERLPGRESGDYLDAVFLLFSGKSENELLQSPWLNSLVPEEHRDYLLKLSELFPALQKLFHQLPVGDRYLVLGGNRLICLLSLFLEWAIRKRFPEKYPLMREISESLHFSCVPEGLPAEFWLKSFQDFSVRVAESRFYLQELGNDPRFSLAVRNYGGKKGRTEPKNPGSLTVTRASDTRFPEIKSRVLAENTPGTKVPGSFDKQGKNRNGGSQDQEPTDRKAAAIGRISRLQKSDRSAYLSLVEEYMRSLDDSARTLISDIRKRMQPDVFEQHMQHRLVRFMMQDYTKWVPSG